MRGVKQERHAATPGGRGQFRIPQVPMEWLDAGSWRLPSGKALAEFALQAGFLAPLLFKTEKYPRGNQAAAKTERLEKEGNR